MTEKWTMDLRRETENIILSMITRSLKKIVARRQGA